MSEEAKQPASGQQSEQTLSRVILMGINAGTKEPQAVALSAETGAVLLDSGVTSVTAGSGLSNSGTSAAPILDVNTDGSTLEISTDTLRVKNLGITTEKLATDAVTTPKILDISITPSKLDSSIAGDGLSGGAGSALSVNVDASTIEISTDTLRVKDDGITFAKLLNSTGSSKLIGQSSTGGAADFREISPDASTIEISTTTLQVKDNGITDAKLRQGAARTVIGRSANSTGNVADISLAADGKFLGSRASALGAFYPTQRLSKTTTYALTQDDYGALVDCDTTSAGFTVTLPAPGTVGAGWWCTLRKTVAANVLTIARNASETINGASASNTLNSQYSYITLLCDGTNWAVVGVNDYLSATGSGSVPATTTYGDVASITIPPGEWDLTAFLHTTASGSTATSIQTGISTTSGNSGSGLSVGDNLIGNTAATATYDSFVTVPNYRILLTSSTTYYQKIRGLFSAGTPTYVGKFTARRVG